MFRAVLLDKDCWTEHMRLDPETGLDPLNAKLRAAQGKLIITHICVYLHNEFY